MFKLDLSPTYYAPVHIDMLSEDGLLEKHTFDAKFARFDAPGLKTLGEQIRAGALAPAALAKLSEAEQKSALDDDGLLAGVLKGWRGVKDADNADMPYSPAALERLLLVPGMRHALVMGFYASLAPKENAALITKN